MSCVNLACNLDAIPAGERAQYRALVKAIGSAAVRRDELENGYRFELDGSIVGLQAVAEWISLERHCCPFLRIELATSGDCPNWMLTLTGREGVKEIIDFAFPAR